MYNLETAVNEDHFCVISDLHLGNPAFTKRDYLSSFLRFLSKQGASLCINGDGFDLLQSPAAKFAQDLQSAVKSFKDFLSPGQNRVYYVNGNHDIDSAIYLAKTGIGRGSPFLNLRSGNRRIHIEHGHRFDGRFKRFPRLYIHLARVLGKLLRVSPKFFHLYFKIEWCLYDLLSKSNGDRCSLFDTPRNLTGAANFFTRGFDIVILAHTHRHGIHIMEDGKILANAGAWTSERIHYLEVKEGAVRLKEWG
jgi:UDP-2,3-diacylglucosamine pyrophosphatase LpxH